jgi:catechol 2,3-dioxygenase-like lactoylglutathione lyase family enzyme
MDSPSDRERPLHVTRALAALAVRDIDAAVDWATRLLGRPPDARPMDTLVEWHFEPQGALQLVLDPARAGGSVVTLQVADIAAAQTELAGRGVDLDYDDTTSTKVKFAQLTDPDGNAVTLVEPFDAS